MGTFKKLEEIKKTFKNLVIMSGNPDNHKNTSISRHIKVQAYA